VHARVPPANQLARRLHDGRDKVTRVVIVSNVDTALLVMGLDHDFNLRRLERYLALVRMAGVRPWWC
jgi:ribosome biogenesis GTPase / thiamine phosphate phosphatase